MGDKMKFRDELERKGYNDAMAFALREFNTWQVRYNAASQVRNKAANLELFAWSRCCRKEKQRKVTHIIALAANFAISLVRPSLSPAIYSLAHEALACNQAKAYSKQ